jgi:hypothetical protein
MSKCLYIKLQRIVFNSTFLMEDPFPRFHIIYRDGVKLQSVYAFRYCMITK